MTQALDDAELRTREERLTLQLAERWPEVHQLVEAIDGRTRSRQSFHAQIGCRNTTFTDAIFDCFPSPEVFLAKWLDGLAAEAESTRILYLKRGHGTSPEISGAYRLITLLAEPEVCKYLELFLERNFYRNYRARIRAKPSRIHWSLWFGDNRLPWGLLITPVRRRGAWTNDVSEIRRTEFDYWTVGHVLHAGLVDPDSLEPIRFAGLREFYAFYRSVLSRVSQSQYEKMIADHYLSYIARSSAPLAEPLLVPELRYAGLHRQHKYRLDFAILNSHVFEFIGFEISPHSSHMSVTGMRDKSQKVINEDLARKWNKEMAKRNEYFETYGITTITFTDSHLEDVPACFSKIEDVISRRPSRAPQPAVAWEAVRSFQHREGISP